MKTPAVLGVDVSLTSTGIAVVWFGGGKRPQLVHVDTIKTTPRQQMAERLAIIQNRIEEIAVSQKIKAAGVETGIVHRGRMTTLKLAQARGAVLVGLQHAGVKKILDINAQTAKKAAGKGGASKAETHLGILRRVSGTAGAELNDDEADAVAIALAARNIIDAENSSFLARGKEAQQSCQALLDAL